MGNPLSKTSRKVKDSILKRVGEGRCRTGCGDGYLGFWSDNDQ